MYPHITEKYANRNMALKCLSIRHSVHITCEVFLLFCLEWNTYNKSNVTEYKKSILQG